MTCIRNIRTILAFLLPVAVLFLVACTDDRAADAMRQELLRAREMNKEYVPFTTDSVMRKVAAWYDRHGTPNERMEAHYLLGCVYRDLGEAPRAIDCYLDAAACADTTATDCDFRTLGSIYAQMADLYYKQFLLSYSIDARRRAHDYAIISGDTALAQYDREFIAGTYILMNRQDTAEYILKDVCDYFQTHGQTQASLQTSLILMYIYSHRTDRITELDRLVTKYDAESTLFDESHELPPYSRIFYCYKGRCLEDKGELDSAEIYYRKVYYTDMPITTKVSMYKGLTSVFRKTGNSDSIAKYSALYCEANDSSVADKDQELTAQMAASYNYNRYQREAYDNEIKFYRTRFMLFGLITCMCVVIMATFSFVKHYRKKQIEKRKALESRHQRELQKVARMLQLKQEEFEYLRRTLERNRAELDQLNNMRDTQKKVFRMLNEELKQSETKSKEYHQKYTLVKNELEAIIAENERKETSLQNEIQELKEELEYLRLHNTAPDVMENYCNFAETVKRMKYLAGHPLEKVTEKEWDDLGKCFSEYYPALYHDLSLKKYKNNNLRCRICMLTAIGLRNGEQAVLLDVSKQTITNNMSAINNTLFNESSTRTLYKHLVERYNILAC